MDTIRIFSSSKATSCSVLSAYFINNLKPLIKKYQPDFWLYGHTHANINLEIGKTKIKSNQRGYPYEQPEYFDEDFVIEIV